MKILQICAYAAPYEGNFMKSLYALEERMAKLGYETIYAFPVHAEEHRWCRELAQSHQVYFLPVSKAALNPKVYKTLYHIFKVNPDVTIAHSHFECYDVPLNIAASPKNKGVLVSSRSYYYWFRDKANDAKTSLWYIQ